jgi:ADP-ribose pyrophosphatase YjhB (NUDIX family)
MMLDDGKPVNLRCSTVVFRDNSLLMCQRLAGKEVWVLPGGTPRQGEGSAHCAAREVAEETGLEVDVDRVAFVLEASSNNKHLIEIVFLGSEREASRKPSQLEPHLRPSFVPLDTISQVQMLPPLAGYIRGLAGRAPLVQGDLVLETALYLGNLWRPEGAVWGL